MFVYAGGKGMRRVWRLGRMRRFDGGSIKLMGGGLYIWIGLKISKKLKP